MDKDNELLEAYKKQGEALIALLKEATGKDTAYAEHTLAIAMEEIKAILN
jgi:hypothetical protein